MPKHDHILGTCCGCLSLRQGVFLYSSSVLFLSICAVLTLLTEDSRVLVGGYSFSTNLAVVALGVLGTVFSLGALVGITDNASGWVRTFAHFALFLRLPTVLLVAGADLWELQRCEHLAAFGGGLTSLSGGYYNVALESVSLHMHCGFTRAVYFAASAVDVLLSAYGVYMTYQWCHRIDHCPRYHLAFGESRPLRIYTGYRFPPAPADGEALPLKYTPDDAPMQVGRL